MEFLDTSIYVLSFMRLIYMCEKWAKDMQMGRQTNKNKNKKIRIITVFAVEW